MIAANDAAPLSPPLAETVPASDDPAALAADPAPLRPLSTVERAFELARTGGCRTIEELADQLKSEHLEAVDAHLFGSSIRKDLRQACAEGRIARGAALAAARPAMPLGRPL